MNQATSRMAAWLCLIAGNFLAFIGVSTNMWSANTISKGGLTDPSAFSAIYTYTSILVVGGVILIVIGLGFIWHARAQAAAQVQVPQEST